MRAKDDHSLPVLHVRVRVARVGVESPLEHGARDVHGTGDETLPPALIARAQIDDHRSIAQRLECGGWFEPGGNAALGIRQKLGRVSVERVLSGPGLVNVAEVIHTQEGAERTWKAHQAESGGVELPAIISKSGLGGSCSACVRALDVFTGIYGSEAGNLALRCVARGGIYIGGGIAPRILPALRTETFERAFRDKEPHKPLLAGIPVSLLLDDRTALWGAARHASLELV